MRECFIARTPEEARALGEAAASVCRDAWRIGEALTELLTNAVEHGNLGLGHEDKRALRACGNWEAEVARRLAASPYAQRTVRLVREGAPGRWVFEIEDEGEGFDWRPFLAFDPARSAASHGRGIALARQLGLADLTYLGKGNRLRCSAP